MATRLANLPLRSLPWMNSDGRPTDAFGLFMTLFASGNIGPLPSAANDAAAAKAGVAVGGLYQSSGAVRIRLS